MKLNWLGWIALVLTVIGAIDYGLFYVFGYSLAYIIPDISQIVLQIFYGTIAVAGIYLLVVTVVKAMRE